MIPKTNDLVYTLYHTLADQNKVCGYCYKHRAGVTVQQLKRKKCLTKQCHALKKYPQHPYWGLREAKKQQKKRSKEDIS